MQLPSNPKMPSRPLQEEGVSRAARKMQSGWTPFEAEASPVTAARDEAVRDDVARVGDAQDETAQGRVGVVGRVDPPAAGQPTGPYIMLEEEVAEPRIVFRSNRSVDAIRELVRTASNALSLVRSPATFIPGALTMVFAIALIPYHLLLFPFAICFQISNLVSQLVKATIHAAWAESNALTQLAYLLTIPIYLILAAPIYWGASVCYYGRFLQNATASARSEYSHIDDWFRAVGPCLFATALFLLVAGLPVYWAVSHSWL